MTCYCFLHRAARNPRLLDVRDAMNLGYTTLQSAAFGGVHRETADQVRKDRWPKIDLPPLEDPRKARAKQMLDDGASYTEVARTVGTSRAVVADWFPGVGWSGVQRGQFGQIRIAEIALGHAA